MAHGVRCERSTTRTTRTEHHEHRYVGSEKQDPIVTHGPVNDAMHAAEVKLRENWSDIVRSWERTR
jgi:hypothetical protein